jgi:two-component system chemotaxis response regulator CheB
MTEPASNSTSEASIARVLVIDDSAVARGLMTRWIDEDPELTLVGSAVDGEQGVKKATELSPDLIVLDVEMPKMDGLAALPLLLKAVPGTKVVMASTLTRRGGEVTIRALSMGAADYASKPQAGRLAGAEEFRVSLIEKLKALAPRPAVSLASVQTITKTATAGSRTAAPATSAARPAPRAHNPIARAPVTRRRPRSTGRPQLVVIGSSTGGPQALRDVVAAFPAGLTAPVVIAQHMPALFTKILAEHLDKAGNLACKEAEDGERLQSGHIYLAPGDFHLTVRKDAAGFYAKLDQNPPVNFCRPAVDPLFESVSEATDGKALGVIMTGMGHDGRQGSQMLRDAGGTIIAQDEATSIVWGMPGAVAEAGLADELLPLTDIGPNIVRRAKGGM